MSTLTMDLGPGRRFVDAIARRDWSLLESLFAPEARLHALIPRSNPFRDHQGPQAASRQIEAWFKDGDVHDLLESGVAQVADRIYVRYRIRNHEPDGWYLVEHHVYLTPGPEGIVSCDLLCSGFRPIAPPSA